MTKALELRARLTSEQSHQGCDSLFPVENGTDPAAGPRGTCYLTVPFHAQN